MSGEATPIKPSQATPAAPAAQAQAPASTSDSAEGGRLISQLEVIPFCVSLATTSTNNPALTESGGQPCVVGTVTIVSRASCFIWIGWGTGLSSADDATARGVSAPRRASSLPAMGPLQLSMPPRPSPYKGGISSSTAPPSTSLLGGEHEDDAIMAHQMATRLVQKLSRLRKPANQTTASDKTDGKRKHQGYPLFVSCSLTADFHNSGMASSLLLQGMGGLEVGTSGGQHAGEGGIGEGSMVPHQAAALAEREIGRILGDRLT